MIDEETVPDTRSFNVTLNATSMRALLHPGVVTAVHGGAGSGKTTFLRRLVCELFASDSSRKLVFVDSHDAWNPQMLDQLNCMKASGNVIFVNHEDAKARTLVDMVEQHNAYALIVDDMHVFNVLKDLLWQLAAVERLALSMRTTTPAASGLTLVTERYNVGPLTRRFSRADHTHAVRPAGTIGFAHSDVQAGDLLLIR
jgi:ABC-type phosphate/phosphonate transport system ATPase subunit